LLKAHSSVNEDEVDEDTFGYNFGYTCFVYKADDERYDTGFFVFVYYSKNATEADCVENAALGREGSLSRMVFVNQVLPNTPLPSISSNRLWTCRFSPPLASYSPLPGLIFGQSTDRS
jgi:hypothetical protein